MSRSTHARGKKHKGPKKKSGKPRTEHQQDDRKQQVLTHGSPSMVRGIADAVVLKNEALFFLTDSNGQVPLDREHGLGLYYHDCRFLNGYQMKVAGDFLDALVASAPEGFKARCELTNPTLRTGDTPKGTVGVRWDRILDVERLALDDVLTFHNYGTGQTDFDVSLSFRAEFEDLFEVRGLLEPRRGKLHAPRWEDHVLHFDYEGTDGRARSLAINFSLPPKPHKGSASFSLSVPAGEARELGVSLSLRESVRDKPAHAVPAERPEFERVEQPKQREAQQWISGGTEAHSDSLFLRQLVSRSLCDLHMLRTRFGKEDAQAAHSQPARSGQAPALTDVFRKVGGQEFFAAGVPWFATLFGRDSLISAMQVLAFDPPIAAQTLRVLATLQGDTVDEWRDEAPGKILHELRVGELARSGEIPHTPYYGSADATPLFLIVLGRHAAWTGDLSLFQNLRGNVERALDWIDRQGRYVSYSSTNQKGLINQGWKDSGNAIVNANGSLARPPIALVEVQGYVYLAKREMAELFRRIGEADRGNQLDREADDLRARFNRDFWLEDRGFYALALQKDNEPVAVISSNPAQALWTGIIDEDRAPRVVERLLAEDMYSGWGIRTLSSEEKRYNPVGYHLGTVWPHDNSIAAAGLRRYGFADEAMRIFTGIARAAMHFDHYRLPEVFAGFSDKEFAVPVRYPVACHPQAWAAGSVPFMIQTLLGLTPHAFEKRLDVRSPRLPEFLDWLQLSRLRVGEARVDLRFTRQADGRANVEVLSRDGELEVNVDQEA